MELAVRDNERACRTGIQIVAEADAESDSAVTQFEYCLHF